MKGPKISIIIPAYNVERYIRNTVESIRNQTYQNLEIILVNDGSVDGTARILDELLSCDSRIKVIHKENGGVTSARLQGVKAASGEWIGFADGDDYAEPQMYEMLLENAVKYKADISHCGYQMVFPSRVDFYYGTGKLVVQEKETGVKDLLEATFVEPGLVNKLFHKKLVDRLLQEQKMDESIKINEDLLMNYYLFREAEKSVYVDECPYHYQVRKGSAATTKGKAHITDPWKVIDLIRKDCEQNETLYPIAYCRYLRALMRAAMQKNWKKEAAEARKALRKEIIGRNIFRFCSSNKLRLMAAATVWFAPGYRCVRIVYEKVTGIAEKYEVK